MMGELGLAMMQLGTPDQWMGHYSESECLISTVIVRMVCIERYVCLLYACDCLWCVRTVIVNCIPWSVPVIALLHVMRVLVMRTFALIYSKICNYKPHIYYLCCYESIYAFICKLWLINSINLINYCKDE